MPHSQVSVYSLGSSTSCCREHRIFARHGESFVRILPAGRTRLVVDDLNELLQQFVVTETLLTGVIQVTIGNVFVGVKRTTNMPSYDVSNRYWI